MEDKKIEITMEQLAEATAKTLAKDPMDTLIRNTPMLVLAFSIFGVELAKTLFDDKEEPENE